MTELLSSYKPATPWFKRNLADHIGSRENHIDQLRLAAALAVVLGHSWHIALGPAAKVPFQQWTLFGFHSLAVHVFFFLSGLLVTESARRHAAVPLRYMIKRASRIMPALIVNAVLVPAVLVSVGAWTDVQWSDLVRYALRLITMFSPEYSHPGAFEEAPFAGAINGSVWSLRHEIIVYALLIMASVGGALANPVRRSIFLVLLLAYMLVGHLLAPNAKGGWMFLIAEGRHVIFSFLLGVMAHQFAQKVPLHPLLLLPGIIVLLVGNGFESRMVAEAGVILLTCALTLVAAYPRNKIYKLNNDISYGVYIYSWPIQQLTVYFAAKQFGWGLSPAMLFILCLVPLLLVSLASWRWIERPALDFGSRAATWQFKGRVQLV
jgi:peptidoglycan/LPS O-acetylase OafA/YrhL